MENGNCPTKFSKSLKLKIMYLSTKHALKIEINSQCV